MHDSENFAETFTIGEITFSIAYISGPEGWELYDETNGVQVYDGSSKTGLFKSKNSAKQYAEGYAKR